MHKKQARGGYLPGPGRLREHGSCGYEAYTQATSLYLIHNTTNKDPIMALKEEANSNNITFKSTFHES